MVTSSRLRARLELEPLEDRNLLSGGLDPTFAAAGKRTIPLPSGVGSEWATAVVLQKDGKVVLAGQASDGSQIDIVRLLADGSTDTAFGTNGRVTLQFSGATSEQVSSLALDPTTQNILVAGTVTTASGQTTNTSFGVARLTTTGSLDASFNGTGEEVIDVGGQSTVQAAASATVALTTVAVQGNGKVLLSGTIYSSQFQAPSAEAFLVVRLNKDGSADQSFGSGGQVSVPVTVAASPQAGAVAPLALEADGTIVVAGTTGAPAGAAAANYFTVVRLTSSGGLDPTFGSSGETTIGFGSALDNEVTAVVVLGNGKVVVGGFTRPTSDPTANADFAVARLTYGGQLDTGFNGTGERTIAFDLGGTNADWIDAMAIQSDGKILAVGRAVTATLSNVNGNVVTSAHFAVVRFNRNGSLDSSFGTGGKTDFGFSLGTLANDEATAVAAGADGTIVLAGSASLNDDSPEIDAMAVARVLATDKAPDTVGFFDPNNAMWSLNDVAGANAPSITPFAYGGPNWIPIVGDWDGDGQKSIGVFDPSTATWFLKNDNNEGQPSVTAFQFGKPGWIPVVGDWNGDGITTVGMVDPTTETWHLRNSNSAGPDDITPFRYGAPGWIPVAGDWDGDGTTTIGVVDPATMTWYLKNSNTPGAPDVTPFVYGTPGSKPVAGDWNGDGTTSAGYVNDGTWYLRNSNSAGAADRGRFSYGSPGMVPVAGDWAMPELPVLAIGGQKPGSPTTGTATDQDLSATVTAALVRLGGAGADPALLSQLATASVTFGQLAPGHLADVDGQHNAIVLDSNASGWGWFVDGTPQQDEEFQGSSTQGIGNATGVLTAPLGSAALGRMDLLSTVMFGLAQLAGLDFSTPALLQPTLATGVRKVDAVLNVFSSLNATLPQVQSSTAQTGTQTPATTGQPTMTADPNLPVLGLPDLSTTPTTVQTNTPATGTTNASLPGSTGATTSPFGDLSGTTTGQSTMILGQPTMTVGQLSTTGSASSSSALFGGTGF